MKVIDIFTQPEHPNDRLRFQLRFDYTENVDPTILHNLTFRVYDRQNSFQLQTKYYIKGTNL